MIWKNKKILVAGGAGFIGSHLCRRLLELGANVLAVDSLLTGKSSNTRDLRSNKNFSEVLSDLRIADECRTLTENKDYVFQLAANMGGMGYLTFNHARVMYDNAMVNLNMLYASSINQVERFLYTSSACVYPQDKEDTPEVIPLKEEDAIPANPDLGYGWEKLFIEEVCKHFTNEKLLDTRVLRFHNVYGPNASYKGGREKVIGALIRKCVRAKEGDRIEVWGDGKQTRSFLYIDDAIDGVIKTFEGDNPKPINIGSDRLISIKSLAEIIIKTSGRDLSIKYDKTKPQGVRGRNADITRAKAELNWYPKISLEEGIRRTYETIEKSILSQMFIKKI